MNSHSALNCANCVKQLNTVSPVFDVAMPAGSQVAASARTTSAASTLIALAGGAEPAPGDLHPSLTQRSAKVRAESQVSVQCIDIDD